MRRFLTLISITPIIPAFASATPIESLEIQTKNSTFVVNLECTVKRPEGVAIVLHSRQKNSAAATAQSTTAVDIASAESCDDLAVVTEDIDGDGILDIAINTANIGLRKAREVFLFDTAREGFVFAGRLPIAADMEAPNKYKLIESQGGSVYEMLLKIRNKKIRTLTQMELVLDGTICVSKEKYLISGEGKCPTLELTATKRKPICIDHRSNKPRVVANAMCQELASPTSR